jgi:hypothetical protein
LTAPAANQPDWRETLASLPTTRTCDGCDLCCTAVGVAEIGKPAGVRCPHLTSAEPGHNCGLYPEHPTSCQQFVCWWRGSDSALPDELWPARCGFVVAFNGLASWPLMLTVHPDPARPTAWNTLANRTRFKAWAAALNSMIVVGQANRATHVFTPRGKVFKKALYPEMFIDGGVQIGVPDTEFLGMRAPSLHDVAMVIFP